MEYIYIWNIYIKHIWERGGEKLVDEAILDENGSNDDDDKIVARLTPRVPSLVARGGKHSRHSRHPLSVPPTTTSGDVHSTTLLTFLIVVLPGRPLNREISARVESKRDIVLRRNSNGCNPWKKEIHRREFITFSSPFRPIRYRIYVIESNRPSLRFQTPPFLFFPSIINYIPSKSIHLFRKDSLLIISG